MKKLGLLGKNISYSFSRNYFAEKFKKDGISNDFCYDNFDIQSINEFPEVLKNNPDLIGMNVTIPYKQDVIPFLNGLSDNVKEIGAVNTIKISPEGKLIGHNTDYFGFTESLKPLLKPNHKKALILGTGGAAKAIAYGLKQLGIQFQYVSRQKTNDTVTYDTLSREIFDEYHIIVNCSPLGTSPNIKACPDIPYQYFTSKHIAYDLIYNPDRTTFLAKAQMQGATIKNGYEMLVLQAEKAWEIWNS